MTDARERLILALDAPPYDARNPDRPIELRDALHFIGLLGKIVSFVKIGWPLYMAAPHGHRDLIREFTNRGLRVFLDLKFGDIPETVRRLVLEATRAEADLLTLNASPAAIRAAAETRGESKLKLLAVTLLTSEDAEDLRRMGLQTSVEKFVLAKAQGALKEGRADGVIASGQEAAALRQKLGKDFLIVTPGIRSQGVGHHDHKRATTPAEAIRAGADYLVVGRPITQAPDPKEATLKILDEMQKAFDSLRG